MAKMKTYEGMFMMEAGNPDFEAASEPIRQVLTRNEAQILSIKPWDERRLAYEIQSRRRALYVLTYFEVDPSRVAEIEHDCNLNEKIMRVLILAREQLSRDKIEAQTPATAKAGEGEPKPAKAAAEGEKKPAQGTEGEPKPAKAPAAEGVKASAAQKPAEPPEAGQQAPPEAAPAPAPQASEPVQAAKPPEPAQGRPAEAPAQPGQGEAQAPTADS